LAFCQFGLATHYGPQAPEADTEHPERGRFGDGCEMNDVVETERSGLKGSIDLERHKVGVRHLKETVVEVKFYLPATKVINFLMPV